MTSAIAQQIDGVRMSPQQRRQWSWYKTTGQLSYHHIAISLHGSLNRHRLQEAIAGLFELHQALRTEFAGGEELLFPLQTVADNVHAAWEEINAHAVIGEWDDTKAAANAYEASAGTEPQVKFILAKINAEKYHLHFFAPAVLLDSYAAAQIVQEVDHLYRNGVPEDGLQGDGMIPYLQFAEWQNNLAETPADEAAQFWQQYKFDHLLDKGFYQQSNITRTWNIQQTPVLSLGDVLTTRLELYAGKNGKGLKELLLAALSYHLHNHLQEEEVLIGYVNNVRAYEELEQTIGAVGRVLPLVLRVNKDLTTNALLDNVHHTISSVSAWEEYSEYGYAADAQHFNVGFEFLSFRDEVPVHIFKSGESFFGFKLNAVYANGSLSIYADYDQQYITANAASLLLQQVVAFLQQLLEKNNVALKELPVWSSADEAVLNTLNHKPELPALSSTNIAAHFQHIVAAYPNATAVGYQERQLSYAALDVYSSQLAGLLQRQYNIVPGSVVAVSMSRTPALIVALMGVIKAGAVFLPIDITTPEERCNYMLADSAASLFITDVTTATASVPVLTLSEDLAILQTQSAGFTPVTIASSDPLYIIYTSGSTGKPKGVAVSHGSLLSYVRWFTNTHHVGNGDAGLLFSSVAFDLGYTVLWGSLLSGAALHLLPERPVLDPVELVQTLTDRAITFIKLTPSHFDLIVQEADFDTHVAGYKLRLILLGGEAIKTTAVEKYFAHRPETVFVNHYGPTEATIGALAKTITHEDFEAFTSRPVIGRPLGDNKVYVLQEGTLQRTPVGGIGEICISGNGLAIGYVNNAPLTIQKFIPDPWQPGERLYRTGDLGRLYADGNIAFLGRTDFQVKIRGYRVEPGEIEDCLRQFPGVREVTVIARKDEQGDNYLCAYFSGAAKADKAALDNFLRQQLPAYYLPAYYVNLHSIPLTPNGKVNRHALPDPAKAALKATVKYAAPRNALEITIAKVWEEVLQKKNIGIHDNFFDLGGHSIKGIRIISRLSKELQVKLEIRSLFETLSISGLADRIRLQHHAALEKIVPLPVQDSYALSHAQKRIWVLCKFEEVSVAYNMLGNYVLENINREALERAVYALIERHESLRMTFRIIDGVPRQVVNTLEASGFHIQYDDRRAVEDKKALAQQYLETEANFKFDLENGPLIRVHLVQLEDNRYFFIYNMHHIISDGWSMQVFVNDVLQCYRAFAAGEENPFKPLKLQYKDFAGWQNQLLQSPAIKLHQQYWWDQMSGDIPVLNLPLDHARPKVKTYNGRKVMIALDKTVQEKLEALSKRTDASMFIILLAAVKGFFYRYTGQTDIIIGVPNAGREHLELEDQIGFYINSLPVRTRFSGEQSFEELISLVKTSLFNGLEHQLYPFDRLVDDLQLDRDMGRTPLFDVMVQLKNYQFGNKEIGANVDVQEEIYEMLTSQFDLSIDFLDTDDGVRGFIEFNTDLFELKTIQSLWKYLQQFMDAAADEPQVALSGIEYLQTSDLEKLLERSGVYRYESAATYPHVLAHFQEHLSQQPNATAIVYDTQSLTYNELDTAAEKVAHFIRANVTHIPGKQPVAAVLMDKSPATIIAVLGILKAGAVCLPVDPSNPYARIQFIINDAGAAVLLSEKKYLHLLNKLQWECPAANTFLCMDTADVYEVAHEWEEVKNEQEIWDYVGTHASDDIAGGGWTSSYTGQELSREDMDEYADNIRIKLQPYLNKGSRVLEIGCSSGISMFKLAPLVQAYFGTDLSENIIQKTRKAAASKGFQNISLQQAAAHEIDGLPWSGFDVIILNSVVQSFHGHNYLRQVIAKCMSLLNDNGIIFFGDIQDQDLKEALIADLEAFKAANKDKGYFTKTDWSYELFLSRDFFNDLRYDYPSIITVLPSAKAGTLSNELTKFRYDCVLMVDKSNTVTPAAPRIKQQFGNDVLTKYEKLPAINWYSSPEAATALAYIIYTSGTTGQPKGVMIPYRGLNNLVIAYKNDYGLSAFQPCLLQTASIAFDVFFADLCRTLFLGGKLVMCNADVILDPVQLYNTMQKQGVNVFDCTPALVIPFMEYVYEQKLPVDFLQLLILGSDICPAHEFKKIYERFGSTMRVMNCYGTTETTIEASFFEAEAGHLPENGITPIGKPISNLTYYVLDDQGKLVPDGVSGVLHIGGEGVAAGYINRPALNALRFVPDPFIEGNTMFNTGDVVSWNHVGQIAFNGRNDYQVKIRGYRIELGEIENQLLQVDHITQAAVVTQKDADNINVLVAYYTTAKPLAPADVRVLLQAKLPEYMVPVHLHLLDVMPLSANGKIDRKALLSLNTITTTTQLTGPRNELETQLCNIWSEVLGRNGEVGIHENFFDIGGHSLKATRVISRIYKDMGINVELRNIFLFPTIESLAGEIARLQPSGAYEAIPVVPDAKYYAITPAQKQMWTLHNLDQQQSVYNMPAAYRIRGPLNVEAMQYAFSALVERHEVLRTTFHLENKEVWQQVNAADTIPGLLLTDLTTIADKAIAADAIVQADAQQPFDLETGPLFRGRLLQLEAEEVLLIINIHHIIADGWSHVVMVNDLLQLYSTYIDPATTPLAPLRIQFSDYAAMYNSAMNVAALQEHRDFWKTHFQGFKSVLPLPVDTPRSDGQSMDAEKVFFTLDKASSEHLHQLAKTQQTTLYASLLGLYTTFISHITGEKDIVTGSPVSGRDHIELENQLGLYLNLLPLRLQVSTENSFADLVATTGKTVLATQTYKRYPFDQLLQDLNWQRQPGRAPLFDIGFTLQNIDGMESEQAIAVIDSLDIAEYNNNFRKVKTDLWMHAWEQEDGIGCSITYNKQLYKPATIAGFVKNITTLAGLLIKESDTPLSRVLDQLGAANKDADRQLQAQAKTKNMEKFFSAKKKAVVLDAIVPVKEGVLETGKNFPLLLQPGLPDVDLVQWVSENRASVKEKLQQQGALLFRGFKTNTIQDFDKVCDALGEPKIHYKDQSSPRKQVQDKLYTSTEHPADQQIHMHNELSYSHTWPQYILFFCGEAAAQGGETPVADARAMLQTLSESTVQAFREKGIRYVRNLKRGMGLSWQEVYQTSDRNVVEKHCRENDIQFTWISDDHLRVSWKRPAIRNHPVSGEAVWFNHGLFFNAFTLHESILELARDEEDLPFNTCYGDGTPIPTTVLEEIAAAYEKCKAVFEWQSGDILLLDNMLMSHGRNAFTGKRKVYVSMLTPLS